MSSQETGSPALAQMIHMTDLFTWLVQTAGKVLAVLILTPLALGIVGAFIDADGGGLTAGVGIGSALSLLILLVWLPTTTAPFPRDRVIELLDAEVADETATETPPATPSVEILGPESGRRPRGPGRGRRH
ncbi:hypothetical protein [Nocardioides sp. SYSU DS0651]|uniref:hypothetical protein n=1 Tax=Nocardioides sp. SYSU DS0651 TaxID=3415955 RepID=UPI003F4B433B